MQKRFVVALAIAVMPGLTLWAKHNPSGCGTNLERGRQQMFLHKRAIAGRKLRAVKQASTNQDYGNIAVIEDSNGVIDRLNPFDLNQKTLLFQPSNAPATSYMFTVSDGSFDSAGAAAGQLLALGDDDTRLVNLPFSFPYFGQSYQQIYVNSDGNLTFTEGDSSSDDRSVGRFTAGPPRIAPLYTDLNPQVSSQGVFVTASAQMFEVSWLAVPPWESAGQGPPQTFQVRLYPDGRVESTWQTVNLTDAVVGISPGGLRGDPVLVAFSAGSAQSYSGPVAESFAGADAVDIVVAGQRFFETHDDSYDYLVLFTNEGVQAAAGAVAYEVTVRNSRSGYGDPTGDDGQDYGSPKRLQSVLNMGPLNQYPADPNAPVPLRGPTGDTTLTLLGHETGHLFLAYASVTDPANPQAQPMLGRALVHWSFLYDSEASLLEGNRIQDNGTGSTYRFTTVATVQGYSPLDQYLMGFRTPDEVPPTFYVYDSPQIANGAIAPQKGVSFNGQRQDVSVQDVISVAGRRTPDATLAQRNFRFAFVLIVPAGTTPDASQIAQLETYRSNYIAAYAGFTSGRATADPTLKKAVHLSIFPAAGVLAGGTATGSVTLDHPATAALTVGLSAGAGLVRLPASVMVPAGGSSASFVITGITAGVDTVTAQPVDDNYETVLANVQVAAAAGLTLSVVSREPLAVQLSDTNQLPYPGVTLQASATGGGSIEGSAVTNAAGQAIFHWTPGSGANSQLTVSLSGGPQVTITAGASPAFTATAVVNAASFAQGLCPNTFGTIFGTNLTGATVSINNEAAAVSYAAAGQINFLTPADVVGNSAVVKVATASGTAAGAVPVLAVQPGIFAALAEGGVAEIFATGLGGSLPQVTIGGQPATVLYHGPAPGFPGLMQVNTAIPSGSGSGAAVQLTVAGLSSNVVKIQ